MPSSALVCSAYRIFLWTWIQPHTARSPRPPSSFSHHRCYIRSVCYASASAGFSSPPLPTMPCAPANYRCLMHSIRLAMLLVPDYFPFDTKFSGQVRCCPRPDWLYNRISCCWIAFEFRLHPFGSVTIIAGDFSSSPMIWILKSRAKAMVIDAKWACKRSGSGSTFIAEIFGDCYAESNILQGHIEWIAYTRHHLEIFVDQHRLIQQIVLSW